MEQECSGNFVKDFKKENYVTRRNMKVVKRQNYENKSQTQNKFYMAKLSTR